MEEEDGAFSSFLVKSGVLDEYQTNNLDFSSDEVRVVYSLADIFHNLTPNECYDLAHRLFSKWEMSYESGGSEDGMLAKKVIQILVARLDKNHQNQKVNAFGRWKADMVDHRHQLKIQQLSQYMAKLAKQKTNTQPDMPSPHVNQFIDPEEGGSRSDRPQYRSSARGTPQQWKKYPDASASLHIDGDQPSINTTFRSSTRENPNYSGRDENRGSIHRTAASSIGTPSKGSIRGGSSIFERLHEEANFIAETKHLKESIRMQREVQSCTFRPEVSPASRNITSNRKSSVGPQSIDGSSVFERLNQSKNDKAEQREYIRQAHEMKGCSFQPNTSLSKSGSKKSLRGRESVGEVHSRLYKEADEKRNYKRTLELENKDKELNGCTFQPDLKLTTCSTEKSQDREDSTKPAYQRLFDTYNQKQKNLVKKSEEIKDDRFKECTFVPQRFAKNSAREAFKTEEVEQAPAHERLYKKHAEIEQKKEQKRKEIENEQAKNFNRPRSRSAMGSRATTPRGPKLNTEEDLGDENELTQTQGSVYDRLHRDMEVNKQRAEKRAVAALKEVGATFTPRINSSSKMTPKKSFFERSDDFSSKKMERVNSLKSVEAHKYNFHPRVNQRRSTTGDSPMKVGERLYDKALEYERKKEVKRLQLADDSHLYQPQLSKNNDRYLRAREERLNSSREDTLRTEGDDHSKQTQHTDPALLDSLETEEGVLKRIENRTGAKTVRSGSTGMRKSTPKKKVHLASNGIPTPKKKAVRFNENENRKLTAAEEMALIQDSYGTTAMANHFSPNSSSGTTFSQIGVSSTRATDVSLKTKLQAALNRK
eukprot:CAMPEP_0114979586 /NCGR_PEP_ID=MMETSP0216-20121206/4451_1 /TAXON_ID=223996 /ORGANISM="Protocruzia adherens, Strain Boccale" /LENGTH=820 /DNA_ID=CAMNT_0002340923 /DNA_START=1 /DNA_END=2466 /DNA_ORIENTATION=+